MSLFASIKVTRPCREIHWPHGLLHADTIIEVSDKSEQTSERVSIRAVGGVVTWYLNINA